MQLPKQILIDISELLEKQPSTNNWGATTHRFIHNVWNGLNPTQTYTHLLVNSGHSNAFVSLVHIANTDFTWCF